MGTIVPIMGYIKRFCEILPKCIYKQTVLDDFFKTCLCHSPPQRINYIKRSPYGKLVETESGVGTGGAKPVDALPTAE